MGTAAGSRGVFMALLAVREPRSRALSPLCAPPFHDGGPLGWRAPQAVTAWQGTREANRFAPVCPQPSSPPGGFYQREFFQTAEAQSEDCLYLNAWTAVNER
jgi:para-nitrobenzyl esterase